MGSFSKIFRAIIIANAIYVVYGIRQISIRE